MNGSMPPADVITGAIPETHLDRVIMAAFLENVPDFVHFKDQDGRFIAVSASKLRRNGSVHLEQILGKTDFDFFSQRNSELAKADEEEVMRTEIPMLRKLEKVVWADGHTTWAVINKLPLLGNNSEVIGTFGVTSDVTEAKENELALEKAHLALMDASRSAGMAEIATGVLHNVGNVLNSLNVGATILVNGLRDSKAANLAKLSELLREHADDPDFLTRDPRGRRVPEFLDSLAQHLDAERNRLLQEIVSLQKNIEHIKEIVSVQQAYATMARVVEPLNPVELVENALRMNESALARHAVAIQRDFHPTGLLVAERAKVLQILVGLISNAKYAAEEGGREDRCITLGIRPAAAGRIHLIVSDNGVGLPPDALSQIFSRGFTTRQGGKGFGLHSSAFAASEMNGILSAQSKGPGNGATFTLDLPAQAQ